jgi:hypothetical protein
MPPPQNHHTPALRAHTGKGRRTVPQRSLPRLVRPRPQLFKVGEDTFAALAKVLRARDNSVLAILNFTGAPDGPRGLPASLAALGGPLSANHPPACSAEKLLRAALQTCFERGGKRRGFE